MPSKTANKMQWGRPAFSIPVTLVQSQRVTVIDQTHKRFVFLSVPRQQLKITYGQAFKRNLAQRVCHAVLGLMERLKLPFECFQFPLEFLLLLVHLFF
jgi:hypothetical protein